MQIKADVQSALICINLRFSFYINELFYRNTMIKYLVVIHLHEFSAIESRSMNLPLTLRGGIHIMPPVNMTALRWGYSSAGRALAWHARGQRFDPA